MLVTFRCDASVNVIFFAEIAVRLLKLMGHSGTIPSALLAKDVAPALKNLKQAIDDARAHPEDTPGVSIVHRALPLLALLEAAEQHECDVLWD